MFYLLSSKFFTLHTFEMFDEQKSEKNTWADDDNSNNFFKWNKNMHFCTHKEWSSSNEDNNKNKQLE